MPDLLPAQLMATASRAALRFGPVPIQLWTQTVLSAFLGNEQSWWGHLLLMQEWDSDWDPGDLGSKSCLLKEIKCFPGHACMPETMVPQTGTAGWPAAQWYPGDWPVSPTHVMPPRTRAAGSL